MPQGDVEFITISSGRIHDVVRAALLVCRGVEEGWREDATALAHFG